MTRLLIGICGLGALTVAACATTTPRTQQLTAGAACGELGDTGRTALASFYDPGRVYAAAPVRETEFRARAIQPSRTVGAKMYLRAQPGLTGEYLERALSCHAGSGAAAHANDPLHPTSGRVAAVSVDSTGRGFSVQVIGADNQTGTEIWNRAEAFTSSIAVEQVAGDVPSRL